MNVCTYLVSGRNSQLENLCFAVLYPPEDCAELLRRGNKQSGVYEVFMRKTGRKLQVYCDMDTDNGGWLVGIDNHLLEQDTIVILKRCLLC